MIDTINRIKLGRIYREMIKACTKPGTKYYRHYGLQGYTLSREWSRSPVQFFVTMGQTYRQGDILCICEDEKVFSDHTCRWFSPAELIQKRREQVEVFYIDQWLPIGTVCDLSGLSPVRVRAKFNIRKKEVVKNEDDRNFEPVRWCY